MKNYLLLFTSVLFSYLSVAQQYEISDNLVVRQQNGDTMHLALAGGFNQPQFSNIDFDQDGILDIVVFDRSGTKSMVFLAEQKSNGIRYTYAPEYEQYLPASTAFMILKDYNADGKPDIWAFNEDSLFLYKNTFTSSPMFKNPESLKAFDWVNYVKFNPYKALNPTSGSFPAIEDVDNDGDIDFVSNLNLIGSNMVFYSNKSVDSGNALDDFEFEIVDKCFGGIGEVGVDVMHNVPCNGFVERYKKKHTATKTILFFDNDNDGDNDLFFGSSERLTNPVYYFENGRSDLNFYKDTFISRDTSYFAEDIERLMPIAPGMFYVDVDNDGVKDLLMSTNDVDKTSYPIREKDNVLLFKNNGSNTFPDFVFEKNNFLVGDMIDHGSHAAPVFGDLDGDGDFDMLIATNGDHYSTGDSTDYLVYYENIGSATNPDFQLRDENYLNIKAQKYMGIVPALADLDDDGDLDLYLGKADGTIAEYKNVGGPTAAAFSFITHSYANINVSSFSAPYFYDMNNDGKQDLLLGSYNGNVSYFENQGTTNAASFTLVDDTLGGVRVNQLIRQSILGPGGFRDTFVYEYFGYSVPRVVEWNDGSKSLAVGGSQGVVRLFTIEEDLTKDFVEDKDYMKMAFGGGDYTHDWGSRVYPATADLNGDSISDILVGNSRGGVNYLQGLAKDVDNVSIYQPLPSYSFSPNPTGGAITIETSTAGKLQYSILDVKGKILAEGYTYSGKQFSLDAHLSNGIYFLKVNDANQIFKTQKLILLRK